MTVEANQFDNTKVSAIEIDGKGRGLVARRDMAQGELIIRSPVKVLNAMEYQVLRLIPSIRSFVARQPDYQETDAANWFMIGMTRLFEDPDQVLGSTLAEDAAQGTIMHTFTWPRSEEDGGNTAALAFGLSSLCNHAPEEQSANAELVRDVQHDHIDLVTLKAIREDDEILIRYASVPFDVV